MRLIPISELQIPENRQRREFPEQAMAELADSIKRLGLMHPIVVRDGSTLVAGERRTKAIELLQIMKVHFICNGQMVVPGFIPVTDIKELSPIEYEEAELEENTCRLDLNWQDKAAAIAKLASLRAKQNGNDPAINIRHGVAKELQEKGLVQTVSGASALVSQSVLIQKHMEDPAVAKAKNPHEAMKIIKRKEEAKRNEQLALETGRLSQSDQFSIHNADCVEWLTVSPSKLFDCILIDPPYGMGADTFGDASGRLVGIDHKYDDSQASFHSLMRRVIPLLKKVGKDEHHLYIFCDIDNYHWLRAECQDAGYWTFRTPLINIKREGGRVPWPENGPRRCYEICLYAVAGKKPVTGIYRDVFESTLESTNIGHGAQKPVECYTDLLRRSTKPGDTVLDCFAGSGTIIEAARSLKLKAVAVEREPQYFGLCLQRLEGK